MHVEGLTRNKPVFFQHVEKKTTSMSENTAVFGKNNRNRQKQLETITLTNNGNVVFQVTFINSICLKSYRKTM